MEAIVGKLDSLAELRAQRDLLELDRQAAIDAVLTPEIRARLAEIEAEFSDRAQSVTGHVAALEAEIKQLVLASSETVRGTYLMAVWARGRTSWDSRGLDGYMVAHPEIGQFRREGEPTVSIRANGRA